MQSAVLHTSEHDVLSFPADGKDELESVRQIEQNEALVRQYFDRVWNEGEVELLDELLAPGYVNHTPRTADQPTDRDGLKGLVLKLRAAFPDLDYEVLDLVVAPDKVAVHTRMRGTHRGELFGIAPTGRQISVRQMQFEHIADGRIVEHWRLADDLLAALKS
jgi:predicted ester cyclase